MTAKDNMPNLNEKPPEGINPERYRGYRFKMWGRIACISGIPGIAGIDSRPQKTMPAWWLRFLSPACFMISWFLPEKILMG